jgi:DNA-binding HxlR family transcriptional regulator
MTMGEESFPAADVFKETCPSRGILARLGERWAMLVLVRLKTRPLRFGTLQRELEGISQKMLTQTLRRLERDGLITRRTICLKPLAVEYDLTPRAREVVPVIEQLKRWAENNWRAIRDANASFDAAFQTEARDESP